MDHRWEKDEIFVFGSNEEGRHGAGAALFARSHCGAAWGVGEGLQGMSYAIPTKRTPYIPLSLPEVAENAERFCLFVFERPDLKFFLTDVGCGLAGFQPHEMAPLFLPVFGKKQVRFSPLWTEVIHHINET